MRLISLNTNYCPRENFWLLINSTDPLDQLKWLADTLQQSEDLNEKVHIIGHIHPSECLKSWSANYYRIVDRYESTIAAQIFGHDHTDQFRLFYDLHNHTRPIAVSYLGPSVTTGFKLNPAYRVYVLDGSYKESTFQILDHYTMYLNITEANSLNTPKWHLEYSAKVVFSICVSILGEIILFVNFYKGCLQFGKFISANDEWASWKNDEWTLRRWCQQVIQVNLLMKRFYFMN